MDNKKLNFKKLGQRRTTTEETTPSKVYQEVEQPSAKEKAKAIVEKPKPKVKAKVGRKSWKSDNVEYTRLGFDTPVETKQKLKQLLAGKFYGKYISQDEMLNDAINDFIKKHKP